MEIQPEYKTADRPKTFGVKWCQCPACGTMYGFEEDDGARLRVGKLRLVTMRAECAYCGNTIWWSASDRHIRKLTNRRK
jgi:hypothetical protein